MQRNLALVSVLSLLLIVTAAALGARRDAFWGTWQITVSPGPDAARVKEFKDKLTFKADQLISDFTKAQGIESMQYTEDTRGGIAATFEAEGAGKKTKAKIKWSGTSTGRDITGEMSWTKPDGSVIEFTFKGEKID